MEKVIGDMEITVGMHTREALQVVVLDTTVKEDLEWVVHVVGKEDQVLARGGKCTLA
jgi:hypothetical protein